MDRNVSNYLDEPYFGTIGGFPPKKSFIRVADWDGSDRISVWCTQLANTEHKRNEKRITEEWVAFLRNEKEALKALHFNSKINQVLLDAACEQMHLEELRLKWGSYTDLSSLDKLKELRYLYIGSGASIESIDTLTQLKNLDVLFLENIKKISDYSVLASLRNLKQISVSGSVYNTAIIENIDFLKDMHELRSVIFRNVRILDQKISSMEHIKGLYKKVKFL